MHVVFLTNEYPPLPSGGIGTSVRNLARALVAQGHQVTVLGWGNAITYSDRGVDVRFVGATRVPKLGWLANRWYLQQELKRLVAREGADIVEAQDWCGISAGLRPGCPIVIRCHGTATYFAHILQEYVRPTVRWSEWLALQQADGIAAVSSYAAEVTRRLFRLSGPIPVILNGVDINSFRPATPEETETDLLLYFGTLVRKKGVLDVCRVFNAVVRERPQTRLRMIGRDAPDKETGSRSTWMLCQQILSPAARERAEYQGSRPYHEMQEHIRRAAVCIFPSYAETFGLSWTEAMACAKPVVAYRTGWAGEIIEPGVSGRLIPTGDVTAFGRAVLDLLADPGQRWQLGLGGRKRVESRFAAAITAEQSVKWYQRVIAERTR